MQTLAIHIDDIQVGERHRALDEQAVGRLAESMRQIGLRQPVTIRVVEEMEIDGELIAGVPFLVAGRHRVAAAKQLGWTKIDCIEVDDDALRAELWEIDENLMRAELTPAQHADHLSRRKEVWEALKAQGGKTFPTGFAADTAKRTGETKRNVNLAVARAAALGDDIREVVGTSLDKGVELDALAKMDPVERHALIMNAKAGNVVTARPIKIAADPRNDLEAVEAQVAALMGAWNRAGPEARQEFMARIDTPVFDRTRSGHPALQTEAGQ